MLHGQAVLTLSPYCELPVPHLIRIFSQSLGLFLLVICLNPAGATALEGETSASQGEGSTLLLAQAQAPGSKGESKGAVEEEGFDFDELEEVEPDEDLSPPPAIRNERRSRELPRAQQANLDRAAREEIRREIMEEVRLELERNRADIEERLQVAETEADAQAYDAEQLRELRRSVNLLQLHGYFRTRVDLFKDLDLGRGVDPAGYPLFPRAQGSSYLGTANMRLRLNPVLRVSDSIAVYSQLDVLDNTIYGQSPLGEPFFDSVTPAHLLASRVGSSFIQVKRVWAEIETPLGQLSFGRKPMHFGEGMVFNDGNCFDCDYGTTFDRVQFTVGPFLAGHLVTAAYDRLAAGQNTNDSRSWRTYGNFGQPYDLQALDDASRVSLQISRVLTPQEIQRRLTEGSWVLNYGGIFAYRFQHSQALELSQIDAPADASPALGKIDAQAFEANLWTQLLVGKLKISLEAAGLFGSFEARLNEGALIDSSLKLEQGAGVLRGQYGFLKGDSLLVSLDAGLASGDRAAGMGARPGRPGSRADGSTAPGDIDGPQFGPGDAIVTNFQMNPDFRIDQILWRNLFTNITSAWFLRPEVRFKPGGRRLVGGDDPGFEISGALIYSQAVNSQSAPGGSSPLGIEANAALTYTSKDRFFLGFVYGALFPLSGLANPNPPAGESGDAGVAQVFRGIAGVSF